MADLTEAELDKLQRWNEEGRLSLERVDLFRDTDRSHLLTTLIVAAREGLAGQWRPIETAPKDGTFVLLSCKYDEILVGYWGDTICNRDDWTEPRDTHPVYPTHWIPLPPPPQAAAPTTDAAMQERGCNHFPGQSECDWCRPTTDVSSMQEREDDGTPESHATEGCDRLVHTDDNRARDRVRHILRFYEPHELEDQFTALLTGVTPSVVSEGEPTPRTKCEPSGSGQPAGSSRNGLQPRPGVGDTKELCVGELVERLNALVIMDEVGSNNPLGKQAATALKQQAEEIDGLKAAQELLSNRAHAQLSEAQVEIERLKKIAAQRFEAWTAQVQIVKRYREALEEYAKIEGPPWHGTPFLARQALTDGEAP